MIELAAFKDYSFYGAVFVQAVEYSTTCTFTDIPVTLSSKTSQE